MVLPELKPIEELYLKPREVFVSAAGFENRILEFPSMLMTYKGEKKPALLLKYSPFQRKNKHNDIKTVLVKKGLDVRDVVYDRYEPESFDSRFRDILIKCKSSSICIDISGMSRFAIMIILDIVHQLGLQVRILYTEALDYAPSQEDFEKAKESGSQHLPTSFIHTGVYDVLNVTRLSSIRMQNYATLLIAFDSFNEALCQALVNSINPSNLILINGRPPRKKLKWREEATEYVHHCLREEWSVGDDNKTVETTSTLYYQETYNLLVNLYWKYSSSHRIILSPTGSKLQTVGCYLLRAVHNDVHLEYPTVQGFFADKYSTGVREHWELDFGKLDDLIEHLRKVEIRDKLGLPEKIIDADIE